MRIADVRVLSREYPTTIEGIPTSAPHTTQVDVELDTGEVHRVVVWNDGKGGPDHVDGYPVGLEHELDEWAFAHPRWARLVADLGIEPRFERFASLVEALWIDRLDLETP